MDGFGDGDFPRISLSATSRLATISTRNPNFILPWFLVDMGHRLGHGGVSTVALRSFTDGICFGDRGPPMPIIRKIFNRFMFGVAFTRSQLPLNAITLCAFENATRREVSSTTVL